jgi:hypothetical protein
MRSMAETLMPSTSILSISSALSIRGFGVFQTAGGEGREKGRHFPRGQYDPGAEE